MNHMSLFSEVQAFLVRVEGRPVLEVLVTDQEKVARAIHLEQVMEVIHPILEERLLVLFRLT